MYLYSVSRRPPPSSLVLGPGDDDGVTRLALPLCDNIRAGATSLRTPLLEDDRESCV